MAPFLLIPLSYKILMGTVHEVAQTGFGAGTNELYDKARPSYQPSTLDFIRESAKAPGPFNIVEIGSGTGIFTRALLSDSKWNTLVKELKAIEPSEGMRDIFSKTVKDGRISISEGYFDATGVEDGWADLVVIAQAFHWCPDYDAASAEFARILKPNGAVALVWNLEDRDGARWIAQIRDLIEVHERGTPQYRHNYWRQAFDKPAYQRSFEPPQERTWSYNLVATKESTVDRASSKSYIAILPEEKKKEVQNEIRRILDSDMTKIWVDESKGTFEYPYKTQVVICYKKQA